MPHISGVIDIFIDGNHVSLMQSGEGADLLFLHGYMSCKESFFYNSRELSKYFRVTAPDFPGFGKSSPIESAWSVSDYADWTAKFILKCELKRPHIIAHSFGARVAIKLAAYRPQILSKLIITGGAGIVKARTRAYKRKVALYRAVKKIAPSFAEKHFGSAEYRQLPPIMRESYKKIVNEDLLADAAMIEAPVLLVYGARDSVTPPSEEGKAFASAIRQSRLQIIEGGHFCFAENFSQFDKIVCEFLR